MQIKKCKTCYREALENHFFCEYCWKLSKALAFVFCSMGILAVILLLFFADITSGEAASNPAPIAEQNTSEAASSSTATSYQVNSDNNNTEEDVKKLVHFHKKFLKLEKTLTKQSKIFATQFTHSVAHKNLYMMYSAASNLDNVSSSITQEILQNPQVPSLSNTKAQQLLQNSYNILLQYSLKLDAIAETTENMANNPYPANTEAAKEAFFKYPPELSQERLKMFICLYGAYMALGYNTNQIDIVNGGLLTNGTKPIGSSAKT